MNTNLILKLASGHLKDKTLSKNDFEVLYNFLSPREQKLAEEILLSEGINIVEKDNEMPSSKIKSYDSSIFQDKTKTKLPRSLRLLANSKQAKLSNETLCKLLQNGSKEAEKKIWLKNKGLVMKYANKYHKRYNSNLELDDLIQTGYIGLIQAANRFDFSKGCKFSTYAIYWIRQIILRSIHDNGFNTIRIPVHLVEKINKVTKHNRELLYETLSFEERVEIISNQLELPKKT